MIGLIAMSFWSPEKQHFLIWGLGLILLTGDGTVITWLRAGGLFLTLKQHHSDKMSAALKVTALIIK